MKKSLVALVTVLYKSAEVLEPFIKSLVNQTNQDWFLYVIDNNEDECDKECFYKLATELGLANFEFISNNKNYGISKGNNQGIRKSLENNFKYTLLLNNDIYFDQNCLQQSIIFAEKNNTDALVPKIYYAGTNKIWMAGGTISKLKGTTYHRGELEIDNGQYDKTEITEYAPTCYMLINNDIFKKIGLMDEIYFVYYDDTDFVFRMNKGGYKISYFPQVLVHHMVSFSTGGGESDFSIYQGNKNRVIFIKKNFSFFFKITSLTFFYLTRIFKLFNYDLKKKKILLKAIYDGFYIK